MGNENVSKGLDKKLFMKRQIEPSLDSTECMSQSIQYFED